jgi:NAD(P)-dependent dehydrogenase (short-subunit alcohol dehydrogenase family)
VPSFAQLRSGSPVKAPQSSSPISIGKAARQRSEYTENGANAVLKLTDVTSEENIKGEVDRAVKEFGHRDIIYNNAGLGGAVGPLEKASAELFVPRSYQDERC